MKTLLKYAVMAGLVLGLLFVVRLFMPGGDTPIPEALAAAREGAVLVDVRTDMERARGAVPGSVHAPWTDVAAKLAAQGVRPDQPVVLYCASGGRARVAAARLKQAGYMQVRQLQGGHRDLMQALASPVPAAAP